MASTTKTNLIGTEITKGNYRLVLALRWNEAGTHWRRIQARTFRIAALLCEGSLDERWNVDPDVGCSVLGRGMLATTIAIELADGNEHETARAEALLRKVAQDIKG